MKIVVISTPIFKTPVLGYSGLEIVAWQQAAGLAARGHDVALVAPDGSTCPGVRIIPVGVERQVDEGMAYGGYPEHKEGNRVLRRAHRGYWQDLLEADVILDSSWLKMSLLLKMEGRLKAPVLCWMHAPVNTMYQTLPPIEKPCFVCISNDQRTHFEWLFGREARTVYNAIDCEFYKPMEGVKRSNRFLFLARFSTIKGPDLAIRACKEAGVGLDLVGDTSITNEPELLQQCQQMADGKQIRIVGPCSRSETVWWYSQAHCMLHPNKNFCEPFGLAPIESSAAGTPVIAWDYGAMRETIYATESFPHLVRSYEQLVQSIKLAAAPGAITEEDRMKCRGKAMEFSVERMIERVEELCVEAVKTGGW